MTMRALALCLVLAGCGQRQVVTIRSNVPVPLPAPLSYCGHTGAYVPPLPRVRTPRRLAQYANQLEASREKLLTSLQLCDEKRAKIIELWQGAK